MELEWLEKSQELAKEEGLKLGILSKAVANIGLPCVKANPVLKRGF